jgi:hypothetical protein
VFKRKYPAIVVLLLLVFPLFSQLGVIYEAKGQADLPPLPFFTSPSNDEYLSTMLDGVVKVGEPLTTIRVIDLADEDDISYVTFYYSHDGLSWIRLGVDENGDFEGIQFNGEEGRNMTNSLGGSGWSIEWETGFIEEGFYILSAVMVDESGNEGMSELMIHYDPTPPRLTFSEPPFTEIINGIHTFDLSMDSVDLVSLTLDYINGSRSHLDQEGLGDANQEDVGTPNTQGTPQTDDDVNNFCGPTAAANALWRLGQNDPRVTSNPSGGQHNNATEVAEELGDDMDTDEENGTSTDGMTDGLKKYLKDRNLTDDYEVKPYVPQVLPDGRIVGKPWWSQFWLEIARHEAVIVLKVKPGKDGDVGTSDDIGHYQTGKDADHVKKEVSFRDPRGPKDETGKVKALPKNNGFEAVWFDKDGDGQVDECEDWYLLAMWAVSPKTAYAWELQLGPERNWITAWEDKDSTDGLKSSWDTSGVHDGFYLLRATVIDSKGNMGSNFTRVYVNNNLPAAVTLDDLVPEDITINSLDLTWTENPDEDFAEYQIYLSDSEIALGDLVYSTEDWTETSTTIENLASGETYYATVRVVDHSGLSADSNQVQATTDSPEEPPEEPLEEPSDEVPPEITIVSPLDTTYITGFIPLEVVVDEPYMWMGYSIDNEDNVTILGSAILSNIPEGQHYIVVYASDEAGNTASSPKTPFTVDLSSPKFQNRIQEPKGNPEEGQAVMVSVEVSDTLSKVESVVLSYNVDGEWHNTTMIYSEETKKFATIIPGQSEGSTVIYKLIALDGAGNWAVDDNDRNNYHYDVPETPPTKLSPLLMVLTAASIAVIIALVRVRAQIGK